jgi:hypothetical protein
MIHISEERFSIKSNGSIGQEIIDYNGNVFAWTTDKYIAEAIVFILNSAPGDYVDCFIHDLQKTEFEKSFSNDFR